MPGRGAIIKEVNEKFPALKNSDPDLVQAAGDIGQYLSEAELYRSGLTNFENALKKKLDQNYDAAKQYYTDLKIHYKSQSKQPEYRKVRPVKPAFVEHLVTNELTRVEREYGFRTGTLVLDENTKKVDVKQGHSGTTLILGFAHYELFRQQVASGQVWKDPSVNNGHGAHTHRLQWHMIAANKVITNGKYANDPCAAYKAIGGVVLQDDKRFGLWDALVDRGDVAGKHFPARTDARSPEYFMRWLNDKGATEWPLVHAYFSSRRVKPFTVTADFLARNIYGAAYCNLEAEAANLVDDLMSRRDKDTIVIIPEYALVIIDERTDHKK